ncbi:hypothetical protein D3C75_1350750 [compost metagenome]
MVIPNTPICSPLMNTKFNSTYEKFIISESTSETRVLPMPRSAPHTASITAIPK